MKKKYDIKTTDVETLKKWYHLMTLGRAFMGHRTKRILRIERKEYQTY